jgi:NAD(P)-dependent dehydrogenase (short-subunit alcohol dehydrogenase family)
MGLAVSKRLAHEGHHIALLDLNGADAQRAAEEISTAGGPQTLAAQVDVTDRSAVDEAMAKVRTELGPIAIVVTSAGLDEFRKFTEITVEAWERMLAVNLTGTFHCIQSAVPDMLSASWGRIVTISSSSAQSGAQRMAHYVASKGGVIGLTKALALDLAPHGITVNTIPPGFIETPMVHRAKDAGNLPDLSAIIARTPVRRAGTPEDIAAACAFLCSDEASYVTGQAINVNGGWYL